MKLLSVNFYGRLPCQLNFWVVQVSLSAHLCLTLNWTSIIAFVVWLACIPNLLLLQSMDILAFVMCF